MADAMNPRSSAGGNRLFDIIRSLKEHGHRLTIILYKGKLQDQAACEKESDCRCVLDNGKLLGCSDRHFGVFLRKEDYETAILSNYYIYTYYAPTLRRYLPQCRLVFDTIDLHQVRTQRAARLNNNIIEYGRSRIIKCLEDRALSDCDLLWMVTDYDREYVETMEKVESDKILVIPTFHSIYRTIVPFEQRKGIIFLGNYKHDPNIDAVCFFIRQIYPLLKEAMPELDVTIAGASTPEMIYQLCANESHVNVVGYIEDPKTLIARHRVSIAPLRYGSGIKGKIGEYLSCGTPCVTTSVGAEGMEFTAGREVFIEDSPDAFAQAIATLYSDKGKWVPMSSNGIRYVKDHLTARPYLQEIEYSLSLTKRRTNWTVYQNIVIRALLLINRSGRVLLKRARATLAPE